VNLNAQIVAIDVYVVIIIVRTFLLLIYTVLLFLLSQKYYIRSPILHRSLSIELQREASNVIVNRLKRALNATSAACSQRWLAATLESITRACLDAALECIYRRSAIRLGWTQILSRE
jgi:hypothetical protein